MHRNRENYASEAKRYTGTVLFVDSRKLQVPLCPQENSPNILVGGCDDGPLTYTISGGFISLTFYSSVMYVRAHGSSTVLRS